MAQELLLCRLVATINDASSPGLSVMEASKVDYSPGRLASLFFRSAACRVRITATALEYGSGDSSACIGFDSIERVRCTSGVVWAIVEICAAGKTISLGGFTNHRARKLSGLLRERVSRALLCLLAPHRDSLCQLWHSYRALLDAPHYLAQSDLERWRKSNEPILGQHTPVIARTLRFFSDHHMVEDFIERARTLMTALDGDSTVLEQRNEEFITGEMAAYQELFDSVESTPLTTEQRRAAVVMEDRNLLVASAGSGKTSTVVGKVGYALARQLVAPEEILIVAFNAHAARAIEERVHERLGCWLTGPARVAVRTFHALGLEIIAAVEGTRPDVAGGDDEDRVTSELIADLLATDDAFARAWMQFNVLYPVNAADPDSFETAAAWRTYVENVGEHASGRHGFRTLDGWLAESQGECAIANWLYMNGVGYAHGSLMAEGPAVKPAPFPGFYLPAGRLYLQHHALSRDGRPAPAFSAPFWACQAWKRSLPDDGCQIIDTSFSDYASGSLFSTLEREFIDRKISLRPRFTRSLVERLLKICPRRMEESSSLVRAFIVHARASQMNPEALLAAASSQPHPARAQLFVRLASRIADQYAARLKETGAVDFGEMILRASRYARDGRYRHRLRLILVDEFQDISQDRAALLLWLLRRSPACKLFAVGDDWQSIYRFAGSDISLFTGFQALFGKTAINYLTRTFRSNQGIAETAAHFVQCNSAQMRKVVMAEDQTREGTLVVRRYKRRNDIPRYVEACLEEVAQESLSVGQRRTVYILGRYRRQIPVGIASWVAHYQSALQIDYRTIHSSKGLQADYVILIGLQATEFPSEKTDDPLLHLVMPAAEAFEHAEERRLLYVALTRARHRVYLVGSRESPSCFLNELVQQNPPAGRTLRIADELPVGRANDQGNDTASDGGASLSRLSLDPKEGPHDQPADDTRDTGQPESDPVAIVDDEHTAEKAAEKMQ